MKKFILFIMIIPLIFSGCIAVKPDRASKDTARDYIVYNLGELPDDLVMLDKENIRQQDLLAAAFEGLVKYSGVSEKNGKDSVVPALAESWSISKDETTYTFNIRKSAYWSDGSKITAYDFVKFFYDILNPNRINYDDYELFCITGAKGYRKRLTGNSEPSIKAIDEDTLEIKLDFPNTSFLDILAEPVYGLRKFNEGLTSWKSEYKNISYSGAFIIQSLNDNKEVIMEKNKNYWNSSEVKSNKLVITSIAGSEECFVKFKNRDVDIMPNPPESEVSELDKSGNLICEPSTTGFYIAFNFKKESINDNIILRRSIAASANKIDAYALSENTMTAAAFAFKPSITDIGINSNSKSGEKSEKEDIKFEDTLKFVFLDNKDNIKLCNAIKEEAKNTANITLRLYPMDADTLKDTLKKGDYDLAELDMEGDSSYPLAFLEKLVSGSIFNSFGYSDSEYDKLVKEALQESNKTLETQYIEKATAMLSKDIPVIPLYYNNTVLCRQEDVTGITITKRGNIMLDKAYLSIN